MILEHAINNNWDMVIEGTQNVAMLAGHCKGIEASVESLTPKEEG